MEETEIASREEVLAMLTEKARKGSTGAMIALERRCERPSERSATSSIPSWIASSRSEAGGFEGRPPLPAPGNEKGRRGGPSIQTDSLGARVVPT